MTFDTAVDGLIAGGYAQRIAGDLCGFGTSPLGFRVGGTTADMYFRLRGTNQGLNVPLQTDANGNPLNDELEGLNDEAKAWADLWFYSNPIFIDVQ